MTETMRLDRFLWFARLTRSREAARALAREGRLRIDGRRIERAHAPVRVGDTLTYFWNGAVWVVRIEALPFRRGPAPEARACYAELAGENVSPEAGVIDDSGPRA